MFCIACSDVSYSIGAVDAVVVSVDVVAASVNATGASVDAVICVDGISCVVRLVRTRGVVAYIGVRKRRIVCVSTGSRTVSVFILSVCVD